MKKRSLREKVIFYTGLAVMGGYALVVYLGQPLYQKQKNINSEIDSKILFISRYYSILSQKDYYTKKEQANQALTDELNRRFLDSDKPTLAAANLQKILENQAHNTSVHIVQVKPEKPKYTDGLLTVPVRITVRSSLRNLSGFLQQLENHSRFLVIEDLQTRRINRNEPEHLETRLLVDGFLKQWEPETKKKA